MYPASDVTKAGRLKEIFDEFVRMSVWLPSVAADLLEMISSDEIL